MYLYSILLSGFKSFPSRTLIKLHPGVTAIIGPNGAGKSNIVDAILWAMGEGKGSVLRAETMGDVIFKGSRTRAPLARAEVQLTFVEDEESITVGRRVYRDGESEFLINGEIVRLKDVQDKLWEIGVEAREYVVIEQGQVEQLLKMSPEERMIFLEAAAGVRKYKERRREALRKIWDTEKELGVVRMRETELEQTHQKLKEQLETLKKYRQLSREIEELYSSLLIKKLKRYQSRLEKLQNEAEKISGNMEKLRQEKESHLEKAKELSVKRAEILEKMNELEVRRSELKNIETRIKPRLFEKRDFVTSSKEKINYLQQKAQEFENRISSLGRRISDLEKEREKEKINYSRISAELKKLESELKEKEEKTEIARKNYLSVLTDLKEKQTVLSQERKAASERKKRLETLRYEKDKIEEQLETLQEKIDVEGQKERVNSLKKERDALLDLLSELKGKYRGLKDRKINLQRAFNVIEKALRGQSLPKIDIEIKQEYADIAELLWERELKSTPFQSGKELSPGLYLLQKKWEREEFSNIAGAKTDFRDALWRNTLKEAIDTWGKTGKAVAFPEGVIYPEGVLRIKGEEKGVLSLKLEAEKIEKELAQTTESLQELEEKIQTREKELKNLQQNIILEEKNLSQLLKRSEEQKNRILKLQERLNKIEEEIYELEEEPEFTVSEQEINELSEKLELIRTENLKKEEEVNNSREKVSKKRTALAVSNEKIVNFGKEIERLKRNLDSTLREKEKNSARINHFKEEVKKAEEDLKSMEEKMEETSESLSKVEEELKRLLEESQNLENEITRVERRLTSLRRKEEDLKARTKEIDVEMAQINEKLYFLRQEAREKTGKTLEELQLYHDLQEEELVKEIEKKENERNSFEDLNFAAEREEMEIREKLEFIKTQKQDLEQSIDKAREAADKMEKIYREKIKATFELLSKEFSGLFASIIQDGEANISISEKGLEIEARFTGKRKQNLSMLSGGEKALLSLIFHISLFRIKPAPFMVLDEVDAPLDIPNLTNLLNLLEELKRETQIIFITHNITTARRADYIYGVSMPEDGSSRVYSVSARELFHD